MDTFAESIAAQIRAKYATEEDRLRAANKVLGALMDATHPQKVHGSLGELEACKTIGLTWIGHNARGPDARDAQGRHVELKVFGLRFSDKSCSVNYKYPENVADLVNYYATDASFAGGHYFVAMNFKKTSVLWWVHATQRQFAEAVRQIRADEIKRQLRTKKSDVKKINVGSTLCKKCKRCPRLEAIAQLLIGANHVCPEPVFVFA